VETAAATGEGAADSAAVTGEDGAAAAVTVAGAGVAAGAEVAAGGADAETFRGGLRAALFIFSFLPGAAKITA
jgi:hypothetical protein